MTPHEWDKYIRTGVVHVLAISGQHLVILAGFLWFALPRLGVRQRHGAWIVAVVVLGYALLTGGRPPALRAAVAVCAVCGGLILRRRVYPPTCSPFPGSPSPSSIQPTCSRLAACCRFFPSQC